MVPRRAAETARAVIPGARLVLADSGHVPPTGDPATVAAELTTLATTAFTAHDEPSGSA